MRSFLSLGSSNGALWYSGSLTRILTLFRVSQDYYVRAFDLFSQNIDRVVKEGKGGLNAFRGCGE